MTPDDVDELTGPSASFGPFVGPASMLARIGTEQAPTSVWPREGTLGVAEPDASSAELAVLGGAERDESSSELAALPRLADAPFVATSTTPPDDECTPSDAWLADVDRPILPDQPAARHDRPDRPEQTAPNRPAESTDRTATGLEPVLAVASVSPPRPSPPPPPLPAPTPTPAVAGEPIVVTGRAQDGIASDGSTDAIAEPLWPGAPEGWEPQEVDVRGLRRTAWLRPVVFLSQAAVFPAAIVGRSALAVASLVMLLALAGWSWLVAENARRAKPRSTVRQATAPRTAAAWWLVPLAYAVAAGGLLTWYQDWVERSPSSADRDAMVFGVQGLVVLGGFIAMYWPFGRIAGLARWTGGSVRAVVRWFWAPVLISIAVFGMLAVTSALASGDDSADSTGVVTALSAAALVAPIGAVWLTGRRAMLEIDGSTKELYQMRSMPPIDVDELLSRRLRLFVEASSGDAGVEASTRGEAPPAARSVVSAS